MIKAKKIDFRETNVAMLGSDADKKARRDAAKTEDAWKGCGKEIGIEVWRIEKFKVAHWPKEQYGEFYAGDAYICLNTYKKKAVDGSDGKIAWNIHFWLGSECTQDEAGTAAYKTVELDDLLGTEPVQFREVQGNESAEFLKLFPKMQILEGGVDSGFRHVEPTKYRARLLQVKGTGKAGGDGVVVRERERKAASMNSGDLWILDAGLTLFQVNGAAASGEEKTRGSEMARAIRDERENGCKLVVLEETAIKGGGDDGDDVKAFWEAMGEDAAAAKDIKEASSGGDDKAVQSDKALFRLTDGGSAAPAKGGGGGGGAAAAAAGSALATGALAAAKVHAPAFETALKDAELFRTALKKLFGKDSNMVMSLFLSRTREQLHETELAYAQEYKRNLRADLKGKFGRDSTKLLNALLDTHERYEATVLNDVIAAKLSIDRAMLGEVLCAKTAAEVKSLTKEYETQFDKKLSDEIERQAGSLFSAHFKRLMLAVVAAKRPADDSDAAGVADVEQDAKALWKAGEGKWGTDEMAFIDIFGERSFDHLKKVFAAYESLSENEKRHTIEQSIMAETRSAFCRALLLIVHRAKGTMNEYYAQRMYEAMQGAGTDDDALIHAFVVNHTAQPKSTLGDVRRAFNAKPYEYKRELEFWVWQDTSGFYRDMLLTMLDVSPDAVGAAAKKKPKAAGGGGGGSSSGGGGGGKSGGGGGGVAEYKDMKCIEVARGKVTRDMLDEDDTWIFDNGFMVYAYVGSRASKTERKYALVFAQDYLAANNRPVDMPICRIISGGENEAFEASFDT